MSHERLPSSHFCRDLHLIHFPPKKTWTFSKHDLSKDYNFHGTTWTILIFSSVTKEKFYTSYPDCCSSSRGFSSDCSFAREELHQKNFYWKIERRWPRQCILNVQSLWCWCPCQNEEDIREFLMFFTFVCKMNLSCACFFLLHLFLPSFIS